MDWARAVFPFVRDYTHLNESTAQTGSLFDFVPVLICHGSTDYVYFKAFNFMYVASL